MYKSKNLFKKLSKSKKTVRSDFFILKTKLAFIELRQAFFKTLILHHFNPKRHIQIQTDVSNYTIDEVLSQLTLENLGRWHLVAFFSQKIIPSKTRYETHKDEILAIVEDFKI